MREKSYIIPSRFLFIFGGGDGKGGSGNDCGSLVESMMT